GALLGWRGVLALAAGVVLVAGMTALLLTSRTRRMEADLERARAASADWERRFAGEQQSRQTAETRLQETLAQAVAPLFTLNLTRGADLSAGQPPNVILIPNGAKSIALSLEWQPSPEFQSYGADLTNSEGRAVWSADRLLAPRSTALAITLP